MFSSTSHLISSLAKHLGKNLLVCLIHPWQCSAVMSWHAASIASRRDIWSCGRWSKTFHLQAEKQLLNGVEERGVRGNEKGHHPRMALNQAVTAREWWNATLSHVITYIDRSPICPLSTSGTSLSCKSSKNRRRRSVLYGPITHLFTSAPLMEIAAHMVMLAPLWPGTVTVALLPIMFLPCRHLFAKLKPAS